MADYMGYWQGHAVKAALEETRAGQFFDHSVSKHFHKVRPGDTVWIVNIERKTHRFLLVGRIEVWKCCGPRAAARELGRSDLYEGAYHILAIPGSAEPIRELPLDPVARRLRFKSPKPSDRLTIKNGKVDQQQVRQLRQLTPETVDLFEKLWRDASGGDARRGGDDGEELLPNREFFEGGAIRVLANRYERDRHARDACVAHYGQACQVCDMEFGKVYGKPGNGFIHVHHLVPVSSRGKRYRLDPINDLIPVCPNCHAMLHTGTPPPSVSKLRQLVKRHRAHRNSDDRAVD
jgi:hypothetical protein